MCPEQAACLVENARRIGERADGVVQTPQERLPALAPAECIFGTGPLGGRPRPVGGDFNQCDLVARPDPGRGAVDPEAREPSTILDQRRPDEGGRVARKQLFALSIGESRIGGDIVDDQRLAATARVDRGPAEARDRPSTGKRRDSVAIGLVDDELVAVDVRVVHPAGLEMLPDQTNRGFLDRDRVFQRSQLLVESDQELPLGGHGVATFSVVIAAGARARASFCFCDQLSRNEGLTSSTNVALLRAKRNERIDAGGTPGGEVRGHSRHDDEHRGHEGQHHWIQRRDAVEKSGERPRPGRGAKQTNHETHHSQPSAVTEHGPHDDDAPGAERHADADLLGPPGNVVPRGRRRARSRQGAAPTRRS